MSANTLNSVANDERFVYPFAEATHLDASVLGGKGAGLVEMTASGFPVPPGFVITTVACGASKDGALSDALWQEIVQAVRRLEAETGCGFGKGAKPLLVSVRSGAPISMPGMMDTVLNLGMNEETTVALAKATGGSYHFAADTFARFARMFADIVLGVTDDVLVDDASRAAIDAVEDEKSLRSAVRFAAESVGAAADSAFPSDPWVQLRRAVVAVFESWNSRRAVRYREHHKIAHDLGTAVVVQQMVFGNLGSPSGSGVAFTRDPRDGSPKVFGEYLENGQGEDVVAGTHTPEPLDAVGRRHPDLIAQLESLGRALERTYHDLLDIEFTVQEGVLYLLQVRSGKRTAEAAIRIASDLFHDGVIDHETVLQYVTVDHLRHVLRPQFLPEAVESARTGNAVLAVGNGASPGQVSGCIVLDPDRAEQMAASGKPVILVREFTSPRDLHGMLAAQAIVTAKGGGTSHAAVVARALDKPCIVGCEELDIDTERRVVRVGDRELAEGMSVSADGSTGELFEGTLPTDTRGPESTSQAGHILQIADEVSGCTVFHRVSTPDMAREAIAAGAHGIGTRIDETLVASEGFESLLDAVSAYRRGAEAPSASALAALEEVVSEVLVRVMKVVHPKPFAARIANLSSGVAGEVVSAFTDATPSPAIWLPLGSPELLHAQIRGLVRAMEITNYPDNVILMVGGVNTEAEAVALREVCRQAGGAKLRLGVAVRSAHGLLELPRIAKHVDMLWIDYRSLCAAIYRYPDDLMLSHDSWKAYHSAGFVPLDPANEIDEVIDRLIPPVLRNEHSCELGVTFYGWEVNEKVVRFFTERGFRNFGVNMSSVATTRLLLGRLAFKPDAFGVQS
ncbi:pyruvate, phosphate dikinase [uncultured Marinobacter sp.]|uniref:pyruvate, phosphate dikinase n=1 Tax=uncultured Marinobacter sp. TaxID=187379 RepID=UPI0030D73318|tara:strand:- start:4070 stop:6625 length:2556 start_codon:yes stop_codon:yes gene_type:complete